MAKQYFSQTGPLNAMLGLARAGQVVAGVNERIAVTQYNDALTAMTTQLTNLENSFTADNDYGSYLERFETESARIQADIEHQYLKSGLAKRMFTDAWAGAYQKAHGNVTTLQAERSLSHLDQRTISGIQTVISTPPPATAAIAPPDGAGDVAQGSPSWYLMAQRSRVETLVANAVAGGMMPDRAEEIHRAALAQLDFTYSRDLAFSAIEQLTARGYTLDETQEFLDKAVRLDGEEYRAWVEAQFGAEAPSKLRDLASAYSFIDLDPEAEEQLVGEISNEITKQISRKARVEAAAVKAHESTLAELFMKEDGWRQLSANGYAAIAKDGILPAGDALWWKNLADTGREQARAQAQAMIEQKQAREEASRWQGHDQQIEAVWANPTAEAISKTREEILAEPDDSARRIRLGQLRTIESELEADAAAKALALERDDEKRTKLAEEARKAQEDAEYQRRLNAFDIAIDQNQHNGEMLEGLKAELFDELGGNEQDRNERVSLINRYLDELQPERRDPSKSDPAALNDLFRALTDPTISPEDYQKLVLQKNADGLVSPQDSHTWFNRGETDSRTRLLNDSTALNAKLAIETYFDGRIRAASDERQATYLTQEMTYALGLWDRTLQDPDTLKLAPADREEAFDSVVDTIVDRMAVFSILGLDLGAQIPLASLESYKALRDSGRTSEATRVAQTLERSWENDFWEDQIVSQEYSSSDFEWVERFGDVVYRNKTTGYLYTKQSRTTAGQAIQQIGGMFRRAIGDDRPEPDLYRWYYAAPADIGSDGIDWKAVRGQIE